MSRQTMLALIEEGLANGRISPQVAAYIAAELLDVEARSTGYDDTVRLNDSTTYELPLPPRLAPRHRLAQPALTSLQPR